MTQHQQSTLKNTHTQNLEIYGYMQFFEWSLEADSKSKYITVNYCVKMISGDRANLL